MWRGNGQGPAGAVRLVTTALGTTRSSGSLLGPERPSATAAVPVASGGGAFRRAASRLTTGLLIALGMAPIVEFLFVAIHRIGYPYDLQWMEGGSLELAKRVSDGLSLYTAPSIHFVPWPYTPLYYWVTGGLMKVLGVSFLPLRLVSVGASVAAFGLITAIVRRETRDFAAGVVGAGLYAATYAASGWWMDIGRVDSLFVAITLGGVLLARRARTVRGGIATGLIFFLAFFTKQDALFVAGPVLCWLAVTRRRVGLVAVGVLVGSVVVSTAVLDAATSGWYGYYVFDELTGQGFVHSVLVTFWTTDIVGKIPYVVVLAGASAVCGWRSARRRGSDERERGLVRLGRFVERHGYPMASVAGLLVAGYVGRAHSGGYLDNLMPPFAGAAIAGGLFVGTARQRVTVVDPGAAPNWSRVALTALACVGVGAQLWGLSYSPSATTPTPADRAAGNAFIAELRALPQGGVLVADHPYYADLAGRGVYAHRAAWGDLLRSRKNLSSEGFLKELRDALRRPGINVVILDDRGDEAGIESMLRRHFHLEPEPAVEGNAFYPVTDLRLRPTLVFVRDGVS